MPAMQEDDQRKGALGPVSRIINEGIPLHWHRKTDRMESGSAEVVLNARHRKRSRVARIRRGTVTGQSLGTQQECGGGSQKTGSIHVVHFSPPPVYFLPIVVALNLPRFQRKPP